MKQLENLRWKPRWVSHLGCVQGCLDYLGLEVSEAWLYGATGHAFVINMAEDVCPSGPTAWHTEMLFRLGRNIGYVIDGVFGPKSQSNFAEKQKRAWEDTKRAIDEGLPCYGWELDIPEFYVIYGYDEVGYYFSGPLCNAGKGPKSWQEVGDTEIGILEMYAVRPGQAADDRTTVREALAFALEHAESPAKWIYPRYKAGLAGYDNWIRALEAGAAHPHGMAYNAAVWSECRAFAVGFLKEAKARLGGEAGSPLDEAIGHYQAVAENLKGVAGTFPFPPKDELKDAERVGTALKHLRAAGRAEEAGLGTLERMVAEL